MTNLNLNNLKLDELKYYQETGNVYSLITECVLIGRLVELTKGSDKEVTRKDIKKLFNEDDLIQAWCDYRGKCSTDDITALTFASKWTIDKVIEWLNEQACLGWIEDVEVDKFIDKFKKDMLQ